MSPATTKIAKHAQSTWNDGRRKNFIELCTDTETAWSVNDPPTSRLAPGAHVNKSKLHLIYLNSLLMVEENEEHRMAQANT